MRNKRFPKYPDDTDYTTNSPSYYEDLARKQKLIQLLAEKIWEYEETLDLTLEQIEQRLTDYIQENDLLMNERLENWDKRIDEMPEEMRSLFVSWLNDGTLEQIINHDVLGNKADKTFVDSEIERLDQELGNKADKTFVDSEIERLDQKDENFIKQLAQISINPNNFEGNTHREKIQKAIDYAELTGDSVVMLSPGEWVVDKAIELPSNLTFILNDAHLKLAEGTMDNIIVNKGARTIPLSSNENINIIGIGNAIIDGQADIYKNFAEAYFGGEHHNDYRRISINLFWTSNFMIKNLTMRESQGYGISIENGCDVGLIRDIRVKAYNSVINQDGIDIRRGCSNIVIENISGVSGDDLIALNCLSNQKPAGSRNFQVGGGLVTYGEHDNIENIIIRNVKGYVAGRHNLIRLLVKDGNKLRNISIDNVEDMSTTQMQHGSSVISLNTSSYGTLKEDVLGDLSDISINNVKASGNTHVITFGSHAKDIKIDNIEYKGTNRISVLGVTGNNISLKNIFIGDVYVDGIEKPTNEEDSPAVFYYHNATIEDLTIRYINAKNVRYVIASQSESGGVVKNLIIDEIVVDRTAIFIMRMTNPFDSNEPSFIHKLSVKNLNEIFMDTNSLAYIPNKYYQVGFNMYVGDFKPILNVESGFYKESVGNGTTLSFIDQLELQKAVSTLENDYLTYSVENDRKLIRLGGTFRFNENTTIQANANTLLATVPAHYIPNEYRRIVIGSADGVFTQFILLITSTGQIAVRSLSGSPVSNVSYVILDEEIEV